MFTVDGPAARTAVGPGALAAARHRRFIRSRTIGAKAIHSALDPREKGMMFDSSLPQAAFLFALFIAVLVLVAAFYSDDTNNHYEGDRRWSRRY
ncbi:hypothetical protein GCM10010439_17640 [Actinocorallia aurantiaca]|uniref:Transmembrane protein n=1 Tax=Actinocorallia aurantiaca TaxID=46204 RepID=A0ABP6GKS1_9ACTN